MGPKEGMVARRGGLSVRTEKRVWVVGGDGEFQLEAAEEEQEEPMSPAARLFRQPEMDVYVVAMIGVGKRIDVDAVKATAEVTLVRHPRFSSIPVHDETGGQKPRWVRTEVALDNHIVVPELHTKATASSSSSSSSSSSPDRVVEDYVSSLCRTPLDPSLPLWQLHLLNIRTSEAEAVFVFRIHHSLGDGISLMSLLLACTRKLSDPHALPTMPASAIKPDHRAAKGGGGLCAFLLWVWAAAVVAWNTLADVLAFVATAVFLRDTETPIKGRESVGFGSRRFLHRMLDLDDVKTIKKAMGCTINDVLVGLASAGLSRYLDRKYGEKSLPANIRLRTTLLFNIRPTPGIHALAEMLEKGSRTRWGNSLGYVILPFSIAMCDDPLDYIRKGIAIAERKKNSLEAIFTYATATSIIKMLGAKLAVWIQCRVLSHTTLTFSNVVGPIEEISLCGSPVVYIAPTVYGFPHALTLHFGSYMNKLSMVMAADESIVPDPHQLLDDLAESLKLIKHAVLTSS